MLLFVYHGKFTKARMWRDFLIACIPTLLFFAAMLRPDWRGIVLAIVIAWPFAHAMIAGAALAIRRRRRHLISIRR